MDSNKKNIGEKKSVQPPGREGASGQQKETTFVRTAPKKESPLEERRVVRKPEEPAKPLPQESAKEAYGSWQTRQCRQAPHTLAPVSYRNLQLDW